MMVGMVQKHWKTKRTREIVFNGIGGKRLANEAVIVPMRTQWGAPLDAFEMYASEPPPGTDMLMGLDIQDKLGTIIDRQKGTVSFSTHKLSIKTEPSLLVTSRLATPPITVVATNSGCNFA